MSGRDARPVPRDLPPTPTDARKIVDELDARVDAEVREAAAELGTATQAADRAPENPAPEPPD